MKISYRIFSYLLLFLFPVYSLKAQTSQDELLKNLEDYFSVPKEVAYLHLNKSVLLQGEQLGIAAYVVDKSDLKPSVSTSNLYVQIRNSRSEIVKEEVLLVQNGISSGMFDIDSGFTAGDYTITAFTNWMRNFDEQNYFTEKIKVLDSDSSNRDTGTDALSKIDAQFLPESGHLLNNVLNHVGIIVKDPFGHGLSHATVVIRNSREETIANIELNDIGIGRFSFTPNVEETYTALVAYGDKEFPVNINTPIEKVGITLSASQRNLELRLLINTNAESLEEVRGRTFVLSVQGRKIIDTYPLEFDEQETVPMILDMSNLDPGINILTLFDEDLRPVAERLVFNHFRLPTEGLRQPQVRKNKDSLDMRFSFDESKDRSLSISVLPQNTVSYNRNHTIISYNLLQPFVRGPIENGGWYFEDITERKKYELDNLLITQGWSSYDWQSIFKSEVALDHKFENNFELEVQINDSKIMKRDQRYVLHAAAINKVHFFDIPRANKKFLYDGYKPVEGEKLVMSRVKKNNDLLPAELSIRFSPNSIPDFRPKVGSIPPKPSGLKSISMISEPAFAEDFAQGAEELEEVTIDVTIDKVKERERKLDKSAFSRASIVTEEDLRMHQTLGDYLRGKNLRVVEEQGTLTVQTSASGKDFVLFLDNQRMADGSMFYNYPLYLVDYVNIDRWGMSNSVLGSGGSVKVYTDYERRHLATRGRARIQEFDVPLAYSRKKIFYTPKYGNTSDTFFEEYGVIDWKPTLHSKNGNEITFSIKCPEVDYKLIVEGFTSDGTFIHEVYSLPAAK